MCDLNLYRKKIFSEYSQDGVIEKIFEIIGTTNKFFVEFGSNGTDNGMGNTPYLRKKGFDGLLMDGSETPYDIKTDKTYEVKIEMVTASNINNLFNKYNVPSDFDFLSIDIDGQDFHVWNKLENYNPRVVSIEMNIHMIPGIDLVLKRNDNYIWDASHLTGASITSLKKLGIKKGYSMVCICCSDAIFVRNDLCYDSQQNVLFENMNNESELFKLDIERNGVNLVDENEFINSGLFANSDTYL
jgi:hypothetical protein